MKQQCYVRTISLENNTLSMNPDLHMYEFTCVSSAMFC